ncbi:hypothetical protein ABT255_42360 [Streptomyces mirabilis]|uniref:hypothetical protein n=1 Tax=Streptomyces mirabilis TaxID=68239 RepID=UPI003328F292
MSDSVIRTCRSCGRQVYHFRVDQARSRVDWPDVFLDDLELDDPTHGEVNLTDEDLAVVGDVGTGPYLIHRCADRVTACHKCGDPIRRANKAVPHGTRWLFTLLNAVPDPDGTVTFDERGHATTDLTAHPHGERYRIHHDLPTRQRPPAAPGLTRHVPPGSAPSSVRHVYRGDRESA